MGMLEKVRRLPGHGELFIERENKLYFLHRSITDWLLELQHEAALVRSGHERLAAHIWDTALQPWLLPITTSTSPITGSVNISREPVTGDSKISRSFFSACPAEGKGLVRAHQGSV